VIFFLIFNTDHSLAEEGNLLLAVAAGHMSLSFAEHTLAAGMGTQEQQQQQVPKLEAAAEKRIQSQEVVEVAAQTRERIRN
jgi:histidinol phosphatase-like PHP family hydrolase